MDISKSADAQPLVARTEAVVRDRAGHHAVADCVDERPLLDADVDPAVESLAMVAAHFAEGAGDLVWTGKWCDGPQKRWPAKCLCVELRANGRRRGRSQREL